METRNIKALLCSYEHKVKRYNELELLEGAVEVIADGKMYRRVTEEKASLSESVGAYFKLKKTFEHFRLIEEFIKESEGDVELSKSLLLDRKTVEDELDNAVNSFIKARSSVNLGSDDLLIELCLIKGDIEFFNLIAEQFVRLANLLAVSLKVEKNQGNNIILKIENGYELLRGESGIYIAKGKYDNASVKIMAHKVAREMMFDIADKDLKIDTFRSQGAGGQNVNKVESAIRVTHLPTGIVVGCQDERSQLQNKERALRQIRQKVEEYYLALEQKEVERLKLSMIKNSERKLREYDFKEKKVVDLISGVEYDLQNTLEGDVFPFIKQ